MTELPHSFDDSIAYERFMGRWSRGLGTAFLEWLAPPAGSQWLDIGCGTGIFTELVMDGCAPATVSAIDLAPAQIEHARRRPVGQRATFQVADAEKLPFLDATFDVVVSALTINFIPDRPRALAEMRRVTRAGGVVAGCVWDFAADSTPTWPLRLAARKVGVDIPTVPGTKDSSLHAIYSLFEQAGLEMIATRSIDVTVPFANFDDFWQAQTPRYSPVTRAIAAMTEADRMRLVEALREELPTCSEGRIRYSARANAIKARVPA
jgi:ubiquinone/menaquinone biosynthesis C-methylase UbiE